MRSFLLGLCITSTLLILWALFRDMSQAPSATICALEGIGSTVVGQGMELRLPLIVAILCVSLWVMVRRRLWGWLLAMGALAIITGTIPGLQVLVLYRAFAADGLAGCLQFWPPVLFALFLINMGVLMVTIGFKGRTGARSI